VLVRLRVCERRHEPHVEVVTHPIDGQCRHPIGDHEVGVERQMRTVLLDGTERLDDDAALGDEPGHIGSSEFCEVAGNENHTGTLRPGHRTARDCRP
jgi:hypothetical protein